MTIGAVSEGTLRTSDLLRTFADELDARHGEKTEAAAKARTLAELPVEGDGACFGFWPNLDAIREDIASGELYSSDSTADAPDGLCAVISDHGNLMLYSVSNGQASEVW